MAHVVAVFLTNKCQHESITMDTCNELLLFFLLWNILFSRKHAKFHHWWKQSNTV